MLLATDLTKRYGGVTALAGAGLRLVPGEVHALLGENGAGKSALVKVLAGVVTPDSGRLEIDGSAVRLSGPADAHRHGIAVVSQELSLFPDLDVLENLHIVDGADRATVARRARPLLAELGLPHLPLRTPVGELDLARRQLLEICRALLGSPGVVILDEPTSALPAAAVERLHAVIRTLTARGVAVLYVSHFLEEVAALADRVTILRDGRNVLSEVPAAEVSVPQMVTAMLGEAPLAVKPPAKREPSGATVARTPAEPAGVAVHLEEVSVPGMLEGVSLTARAGEVVGLAGLQGAGHLTVFEVLWGLASPAAGTVRLPDGGPRPRTTAEAVRRRVAFVPSDRKGLGLTLDQTVAENITSVAWLARRRGGFVLRPARIRTEARRYIAELRIRAEPDHRVAQLSGGNQQKVAFAKWIAADPQVVLLDDPTRGVDVGVKAEMHTIVRRLAADGKVVLMCSTDLAELAEVCDRVIVLRRGQVREELTGEALTEHTLLHAMV